MIAIMSWIRLEILLIMAFMIEKLEAQTDVTKTNNRLIYYISQEISAMNQNRSISDTDLEYSQCICDLTPNSCDFNCCCDIVDCPVTLLTKWLIEQPEKCLDKNSYEKNTFTTCFDSNLLIYFNIKRGMRNFTDGTLFCVTYDNSSRKALFYNQLSVLSDSDMRSIFDQLENMLAVQRLDYYRVDLKDYLRQKISFQVNDLIFLRKDLYQIQSNQFPLKTFRKGDMGFCSRSQSVKFMKDIKESKCLFKMVSNVVKLIIDTSSAMH